MDQNELKEIKKKLIELRQRVHDEIRHIGEETLNKSLRESSGDLSTYTVHMADAASGSFERDVALGRVSGDQDMLYRIDMALKKIEAGEFGICECCGKKISKERLKAIPDAVNCKECQSAQETRRRSP